MVFIVLNLFELSNPPASIHFKSILKRCMKCIDSWPQFSKSVLSKSHLHAFFFCVLNLHEFTDIMEVGVNTIFFKAIERSVLCKLFRGHWPGHVHPESQSLGYAHLIFAGDALSNYWPIRVPAATPACNEMCR